MRELCSLFVRYFKEIFWSPHGFSFFLLVQPYLVCADYFVDSEFYKLIEYM